jgi:hypothetical protein
VVELVGQGVGGPRHRRRPLELTLLFGLSDPTAIRSCLERLAAGEFSLARLVAIKPGAVAEVTGLLQPPRRRG